MLKRHYVMVAKSEKDAYRLMRIAANHNLYGQYKIGVYGTEQQHELFITGAPWNYRKFLDEINNPTEGSTDSEEKA